MLKSAIWHKMPSHAQYLIIFSEIFTTYGPLKDLPNEGIKSWPPLIRNDRFLFCKSLAYFNFANYRFQEICNLQNGNMLMICKIWVANFVKSPLRS